MHICLFFLPLCELLAATTISRTKVCLSDHETKDSIIRSSPLRYEKNWARKNGETDTNLGNVEKGIGLVWFHDCYIHPFNILYPWNIWGGKENLRNISPDHVKCRSSPRFFWFPKGWREAVRMSDFGPVNWIHAD